MEQSFNWIKSAILTSNNEFHIDCCNTLIRLFATKYSGEKLFADAYIELTNELINRRVIINKP